MLPNSTTCALGLTIADLTAWQDNQLRATDQYRFGEHIPACAHCQTLLADLARITAQLSSYRTPDLRARIWRGVQAGMVRSPRTSLVGRNLWGSVAGVIALITVVALFAQVLSLGGKHKTPVTFHASPTASFVPSVTEGPLPPIPHLADWQASGPPFASSLVFTQSDPLTGYACGRAYLNGNSGLAAMAAPQHSVTPGPALLESNLPLGVTHDGGKTWQIITTTIRGLQCQVTVDPINPRDIVIRYATCTTSCFYSYGILDFPYLARSLDGGQTWTRITLPSSPELHTSMILREVAWVRSTLFVSADQYNPQNTQFTTYLLKSVQGAPLTFLASPSFSFFGSGMLALGDALYMPGARGEYITHDEGVTWAQQQFSHNNLKVVLVAGNADGSVLLGAYFTTDGPEPAGLPSHLPILESRDGGVTWVVLPSPTNGAFFVNGLRDLGPFIAPDGTILALCYIFTNPDKGGTFGVYTMDPTSQTWQKKATAVSNLLLTVSYDAQGHPARLWGIAGANVDDIANHVYFGLQYHSL